MALVFVPVTSMRHPWIFYVLLLYLSIFAIIPQYNHNYNISAWSYFLQCISLDGQFNTTHALFYKNVSWKLKSNSIRRLDIERALPDVSKDSRLLIFRLLDPGDKCNKIFRNVENSSPNETVLHTRRLDRSLLVFLILELTDSLVL